MTPILSNQLDTFLCLSSPSYSHIYTYYSESSCFWKGSEPGCDPTVFEKHTKEGHLSLSSFGSWVLRMTNKGGLSLRGVAVTTGTPQPPKPPKPSKPSSLGTAFAGQANKKGGQGALQNRQNRQNRQSRHEGYHP